MKRTKQTRVLTWGDVLVAIGGISLGGALALVLHHVCLAAYPPEPSPFAIEESAQ